MATMVDYVLSARDSFDERPLTRVDSLVLSWLAYCRFSDEHDTASLAGVRIGNLGEASIRSKLVANLHDVYNSSLLLQALAVSPRFADVRACLHLSDSDADEGRQFSATSFTLPGGGTYVAFMGTDNTTLGWKENFRLICTTAIPAQRMAAAYLWQVAEQVEGPLWVGGHSKGGSLAVYAAAMADDDIRARIVQCFSHDGPGLHPALHEAPGWHDDVSLDKTVPRESMVGMLFERSQEQIVVVRSSEEGFMQHSPFSWQVRGNDFVVEQGLSYDTWRLSRRLNDYLSELGPEGCASVAEQLGWLVDATGEMTFSGLIRRWSSNRQAMEAALAAAPEAERRSFEEAMDELVATLLLGSKTELGIGAPETPQATSDAASRKLDDLSAHVNDRLSRIDEFLGR